MVLFLGRIFLCGYFLYLIKRTDCNLQRININFYSADLIVTLILIDDFSSKYIINYRDKNPELYGCVQTWTCY